METILIKRQQEIAPVTISLPGSKSESNRALVINALGGGKGVVRHLSEARDTRLMDRLIGAPRKEINVQDAGTVMRFLTAYFALTGVEKVITGTPRMCQRPIGILVDALRQIGARIEYLGSEGYPPLKTTGFDRQKSEAITMRGDVSSQYISAVLMMAPALPHGLALTLSGKVGSKPYIDLTVEIMKHFGADVRWRDGTRIVVQPGRYRAAEYHVEPDWSGASYWCAITALADRAEIFLPGLKADSAQGDRRILDIMRPLGVAGAFERGGLRITKTDHQSAVDYDFSDNPDLAQTVAVAAALKGIPCSMHGLESLRIKETDRIEALATELKKLGAHLQERAPGHWLLEPARLDRVGDTVRIATYDDHRMAMAFAPLATLRDAVIEHPSVVDKSYPRFWDEMAKAGFRIEQ